MREVIIRAKCAHESEGRCKLRKHACIKCESGYEPVEE